MPFLVGDRVTCNAAKVLGNKHAKQRNGRLFKEKELLGDVQRMDGKGPSVNTSFILMKSLLRRRFPHAALGGTALQQAAMLKHPFPQPFP